MITELENTSAAEISRAITRARARIGSAAMAFTLVVVSDARHYKQVRRACIEAGTEHPSRILVVVRTRAAGSRLDAELRTGEGIPGELITLRMGGELADHADSVVLPLLLPDSTVVAWWPHESPENPAEDPIGALASRRITDAAGAPDPLAALAVRARVHSPGDTDLTWTRLTPWRALLAAAVDQFPSRIRGAVVEAARDNAPAELMAAWLASRLDVEVERRRSRGPGITGVRLVTSAGDIAVLRSEGDLATYQVPGQPIRQAALKRRGLNELITEELRRMDADAIFERTTRQLLLDESGSPTRRQAASARPAKGTTGPKATASQSSTPASKRSAAKQSKAGRSASKKKTAQGSSPGTGRTAAADQRKDEGR